MSEPAERPTPEANFCPKCDKCGAPVTTGLMAAFCPRFRECEFYVPELDEFMEMGWSPPFPNQPKDELTPDLFAAQEPKP